MNFNSQKSQKFCHFAYWYISIFNIENYISLEIKMFYFYVFKKKILFCVKWLITP